MAVVAVYMVSGWLPDKDSVHRVIIQFFNHIVLAACINPLMHKVA